MHEASDDGDLTERIRWIVRTKSRYCDLRPVWRRLDRQVSRRLRTGAFGRHVHRLLEDGDGGSD